MRLVSEVYRVEDIFHHDVFGSKDVMSWTNIMFSVPLLSNCTLPASSCPQHALLYLAAFPYIRCVHPYDASSFPSPASTHTQAYFTGNFSMCSTFTRPTTAAVSRTVRWTDFPTGDQKSNGRSVWCVIQPPSGVTITTTVVRTLKWSTQCLIVAASVVSSKWSRTDLDGSSPYLSLLALCSDYYRNL